LKTYLFNTLDYFYSGFVQREDLFSELVGGTRKFSTDSAYLVGALPTDFNSASCGILNGVAVRIEFTLSENSFFLMSTGTDVKFELEEVLIHVPCAELSDELALKIQNRLKKEDALIQFRRRQVVPFIIATNSTVYHSDSK
jgi:hypothetical protein